MSNATSENRGNGQQRQRSRGGRNRNRRNNQGGSPQGRNQQGGNRQGNNRNRNRNRNRKPKPKPLTWWQKLLKAIGLYKEPTHQSKGKKGAAKSNVRNARTGDEKKRTPKSGPKQRERKPVSSEDIDTKRLYLGNLSYEATESDLEELFRGVGTVRRVEIVYNRKTHRSKGYGFVEMLNVEEAKRAVEVLHDQFFMGRKLNVNSANSKGPSDTTADGDNSEAKEEEITPQSAE